MERHILKDITIKELEVVSGGIGVPGALAGGITAGAGYVGFEATTGGGSMTGFVSAVAAGAVAGFFPDRRGASRGFYYHRWRVCKFLRRHGGGLRTQRMECGRNQLQSLVLSCQPWWQQVCY